MVHKRGNMDAEKPVRGPRAAFGEENDGLLPVATPHDTGAARLPKKDWLAFCVLVVLYTLQGVPVGLAFGLVPFILKSKVSFAQVGVFSLALYPYLLKLLWSPIVDAVYSRRIGRRKLWIIPVQLVLGATLLYLGYIINDFMEEPLVHLGNITTCFFLLVFFCATQDIAVDGWALTCLSPGSLPFASTAQTIGMNTGYFSSFTVFLALLLPEFANKYLRKHPKNEGLFDLGGYLAFWGYMYIVVTGLLLFVPEDPPHLRRRNHDKLSSDFYKHETHENVRHRYFHDLVEVYKSMYQVLKLPNVQTLVVILLLAKVGFQVNEAATNLKLLEKGFTKENLSITVLIDFPFEVIFGYYAGRWLLGKAPLRPWLFGFAGRLLAALWAHLILLFMPKIQGDISPYTFLVIILQHLMGLFMSTIQFVSLCAFHTKIADPAIGGTYMTTLNTLSNYGGTWPRLIILYLIDRLSVSSCDDQPILESEKQLCLANGGQVVVHRDGYFYTSALCLCAGVVIWFWVKRKAVYLQSLPASAWRVKN